MRVAQRVVNTRPREPASVKSKSRNGPELLAPAIACKRLRCAISGLEISDGGEIVATHWKDEEHRKEGSWIGFTRAGQTRQRPTLPRLKTEYHWPWGT